MMRRAQGEGSLYYDQERARWVGQADAGLNPRTGKRRRVKVTGETKAEAASRLRERIEELEATSTQAPDTVGELVESWLSRAAPKRMSERTLAMVTTMTKGHLLPVLGGVRVGALTAEDVEAWLDAKAEALARSSIVKLRSYLAQAFDFGIRRRHATWNPARVAELPDQATGHREGRALTPPEARALLNAADGHRLGAWVTVALTLGLRPGEVCGLVWEAVDFEAETLVVYQSLGWTRGRGSALKPTKTATTRTLELPGITLQALREHRRRQLEERLLLADRWPLRWESLVFLTTNGTPIDPSNLRRMVAKLARDAGIEGRVTPYDLRHSATSLLSAAGHSAERLADLLGHRDTRMVFRHYRHPVTPSISVAADYWSDSLGA